MSVEEPWRLYYWPPEVLQGSYGRAEFVRVVLEEAGAPYVMVHDDIFRRFKGGEWEGYPALAVPLLERGDVCLSQTPVICRFLGQRYGLVPLSEVDQWHADQLNASVHDYVTEGRLAFHGKDWQKSYLDQVEETKPYLHHFTEDRLPKFLGHFEKALVANRNGDGFLVGDRVTYADLALLHALRATEAQFPDHWARLKADLPKLHAFKDRMEARTNLKTYFSSSRCPPFSGNSMM